MKRILLLTDSLAMPREEPELTLYEDTYPYLLRKKYEVFQFSKGGGLMKEFVEQTFYYNQYRPDVVILQIGIVDCYKGTTNSSHHQKFSPHFPHRIQK